MIEISALEIRKYLALEEVYKNCELKDMKIISPKIQKMLGNLVSEAVSASNNCINIMGNEELEYLLKENPDERTRKLESYFGDSSVLIILSDGMEADLLMQFIEEKKTDSVIFRTNAGFQEINRSLKKVIRKKMRQETVIEDTLFLEIFGMGVMIQGEKSLRNSLALELIKKKHSFISNDTVQVIKYQGNEIFGRNKINDYTKYIIKMTSGMEFDILKNFGTAVGRRSKRIDMFLILENWSPKKKFERLGLDEEFEKILEINVPKIVIPIRMGRSLSVIVEAVALNQRLKSLGENSSMMFFDETKNMIGRNKMRSEKISDKKLFLIENFGDKAGLKKIAGEDDDFFIDNPELYYPVFEISGLQNGINRLHVFDDDILTRLEKFSDIERKKILNEYFEKDISGILIKKDSFIKEDITEYCKKRNINLYENIEDFNTAVDLAEDLLEMEVSPRTTVHGVLMEIYGLGVLITGKSGVGKSETGLELVTRGHRLIADDRVKVVLTPDKILKGYCGEIPYFMELRGVGIINIKSLYGIGAIKESKSINMVVEIVEDESSEFIGSQILTGSFLGKEIVKKIIHINTGRNTATLVEAVALDYKGKRLEIGGKF
jgi:HPr kinase/phosphorylase